MSEAAGTTATPTAVWYYLDAQSQPIGPYDATGVEGLAKAGYLPLTTLLWCEGREKWQPLSEITDLASAAASVPKNAAANGPQHAAAAATTAAAGPAAAGVAPDDELAAFEAEISAIEAQAQEGEEPGTPEELEFEDDDGTMYIWNRQLRKYIAADDPTGGMAPAAAPVPAATYDEADMVFAADEDQLPSLAAAKAAALKQKEEALEGLPEPAAVDPAVKEQEERKRKADAAIERQKEKLRKRRAAAEAAGGWKQLKVNTSVYVDGLPDDCDEDEVAGVFGKCGIIKLDDDARPRIKLYRDKASGMLKGDGVVTYQKEASVQLAVDILDGSYFRHNSSRPLAVSPAKFEMKGEKFVPKKKAGDKVVKKKLQHKADKALGWDGFDDEAPDEQITVVLHHMFHPDDLLTDFNLAAELEEDLNAECGKLGKVQRVKLFKTHPEGVAMVKFKAPDAAQKCIQLMHGRWFGGRQLVAHLWDGLANYNVKVQETAEEQEARLEAFARELEEKGRQEEAQGQGQQQEQQEQQPVGMEG